jgi:hypothetical protein
MLSHPRASRHLALLIAVVSALILLLILSLTARSSSTTSPLVFPNDSPTDASLVLTKTVGLGSCPNTRVWSAPWNTPVTYCWKIRNTGTVSLTQHTLQDSQFQDLLANSSFTVLPGATFVVTGVHTATLSITNYATWTAESAIVGAPTLYALSSATLTVIPPQPSIVLTKTVGTNAGQCAAGKSAVVIQGSPVTYCYRVRNTGGNRVSHLSLVDNKLGTLFNASIPPLGPGSVYQVLKTVTPTVSATNIATATVYSQTFPTATGGDSDSATVTVTPRNLAVQFTKTVGVQPNACAATNLLTVNPGTPITYCYQVKNTGNVPLNVHTLTDNRFGPLLTAHPYSLLPGKSVSTTVVATPTTSVANAATWTAYMTSTTGATVSAVANASVTVNPVPGLQFTKSVGVNPSTCATTDSVSVLVGSKVVYCFRATNTGNTPLRLHSVTDSQLGPLLVTYPYVLNPYSTLQFTTTATAYVTATHVATWTAWVNATPYGPSAVRSDSATVYVLPNPARSELTKTVGIVGGVCAEKSAIRVPSGTSVYYCYRVRNAGPIVLPRHLLYDDEIDAPILPNNGGNGFLYDFAAGETLSTLDLGINVSTVVTKTTTNVALWESYVNDVLYAQDLDQATVFVHNAQIDATLRVGPPGGCSGGPTWLAQVGESYAWCLILQNTGDIPLTQHIVDIPALGIVDLPIAQTLAPSATLTLNSAAQPLLGPFTAQSTRSVSVTVTSTANPDGAPFQATDYAVANLIVATGEEESVFLPTIRR